MAPQQQLGTTTAVHCAATTLNGPHACAPAGHPAAGGGGGGPADGSGNSVAGSQQQSSGGSSPSGCPNRSTSSQRCVNLRPRTRAHTIL
jgi:hypothetical protein